MSSNDFSHPAYVHPLSHSTDDKFIFLNFPHEFVPGLSSSITWSLSLNGTVSLRLVQGPIKHAKHISTIAHSIENKGGFYWTPSVSIAPGDNYALQIVSDDDEELVVYSPHFSIVDHIVRRKELEASFTSSAITTPPLTTLTSTSSLSTTSTRTSSTVTSTTAAVANTSGGLSSGAAAGIGVGATLGGILIIGGLILFLLRYKRRKQASVTDPSLPPAPSQNEKSPYPPELDAGQQPERSTNPNPHLSPIAELGEALSPTEYNELDSRRRAAELQGISALPVQPSSPRAELEARRFQARQIHEMGLNA